MPKRKISGRREFALLIFELFLAFAFFYSLLQIASFDFTERTLSFSQDTSAYFALGLIIAVTAVFYFALMKKAPESYALRKETIGLIHKTAKEKFRKLKEDPRVAALLFLDFAFISIVIISLIAYLDPDFQLIDWANRPVPFPFNQIFGAEKISLAEPYITLMNVAVSIAIIGFFIYLRRQISPYISTLPKPLAKQAINARKRVKRK